MKNRKTQETWCEVVASINEINSSIDNYLKSITKYCSVIHCVPPDLSVLSDRFHLLMRFNVEYLIITLNKNVLPTMETKDSCNLFMLIISVH